METSRLRIDRLESVLSDFDHLLDCFEYRFTPRNGFDDAAQNRIASAENFDGRARPARDAPIPGPDTPAEFVNLLGR